MTNENLEGMNENVQGVTEYVTPEMFGAVGDGETDDTQAFEAMLSQSTSICIPSKKYKITRKLYTQPNTYISGYGKDSVIVCHSEEDLFMVNGDTRITNLQVKVSARLSGAIFKINEESLESFYTTTAALGTAIDHIWIKISAEVDTHAACFEVSNQGTYGVNANGQPAANNGFFDVRISHIKVEASPNRKLGYFYKSFCRNNCWITGVYVDDCTIYGARWGFFLSERDDNIFDNTITSASSPVIVSDTQHQKTLTNCRAFVYVPKGAKVVLQGCIPWDWNVMGDEDTRYAYIVDSELTVPGTNNEGLVVYGHNTTSDSLIKSFAMIDNEGTLTPLQYYDYAKLANIGTPISNLYAFIPKLAGIAPKKPIPKADGNTTNAPKAMLLYKGAVGGASRSIFFDLCLKGIICRVIARINTDGTSQLIYDKDVMEGIKFAYKKEDGQLYFYMIYRGAGQRYVDGFVRSVELSNDVSSFTEDNSLADYCKTINPWRIPESERYFAEEPEGITVITNTKVNSFAPVLVSPGGNHFKLTVDDEGNVTTTAYTQGYARAY